MYSKKFNKKEKKINLILLKFSVMFYEKLNKEAKSKLITTTVYIFLMINKFGKIHKKWNNDTFGRQSIIESDTDTCKIVQIYFYTNLFKPLLGSHMVNNSNLNKKIIEKLLNDIFTLDRKENEKSVNKFQAENEFYRLKMPCPTNNLHLLKIVGFGQAITF